MARPGRFVGLVDEGLAAAASTAEHERATELEAMRVRVCARVRVMFPPGKRDARAVLRMLRWDCSGATSAEGLLRSLRRARAFYLSLIHI